MELRAIAPTPLQLTAHSDSVNGKRLSAKAQLTARLDSRNERRLIAKAQLSARPDPVKGMRLTAKTLLTAHLGSHNGFRGTANSRCLLFDFNRGVKSRTRFEQTLPYPRPRRSLAARLALLLCGDVESNPGPRPRDERGNNGDQASALPPDERSRNVHTLRGSPHRRTPYTPRLWTSIKPPRTQGLVLCG